MHKVKPEVECLCHKIKSEGYRRVILLRTPEKIGGEEYRKPIAACGVIFIVPGEKDRMRIGEAIGQIAQGELEPYTRELLHDMLIHGFSHGAEALVVTNEPLMEVLVLFELDVPLISLW